MDHRKVELKDAVFLALDNALVNGYEEVLDGDPSEEAHDLLDYDRSVADIMWQSDKDLDVQELVDELVPLILAWRETKR